MTLPAYSRAHPCSRSLDPAPGREASRPKHASGCPQSWAHSASHGSETPPPRADPHLHFTEEAIKAQGRKGQPQVIQGPRGRARIRTQVLCLSNQCCLPLPILYGQSLLPTTLPCSFQCGGLPAQLPRHQRPFPDALWQPQPASFWWLGAQRNSGRPEFRSSWR